MQGQQSNSATSDSSESPDDPITKANIDSLAAIKELRKVAGKPEIGDDEANLDGLRMLHNIHGDDKLRLLGDVLASVIIPAIDYTRPICAQLRTVSEVSSCVVRVINVVLFSQQ